MISMPELTDDAVIVLVREGGIAFIPKLAAPRRIALAQLSPAQRATVCETLQQALPLGKPAEESSQLGSGDQRYFRIEISRSQHPQGSSVVIVLAEQDAPAALEALWRDGE